MPFKCETLGRAEACLPHTQGPSGSRSDKCRRSRRRAPCQVWRMHIANYYFRIQPTRGSHLMSKRGEHGVHDRRIARLSFVTGQKRPFAKPGSANNWTPDWFEQVAPVRSRKSIICRDTSGYFVKLSSPVAGRKAPATSPGSRTLMGWGNMTYAFLWGTHNYRNCIISHKAVPAHCRQ